MWSRATAGFELAHTAFGILDSASKEISLFLHSALLAMSCTSFTRKWTSTPGDTPRW